MDRKQLREEIETQMGDVENTIASDPQINIWINQAIRDIASKRDWFFLRQEKAVTAVVSIVPVGTDVRKIAKVRHNNANDLGNLTPVTERWLLENYDPASNETSKPWFYAPTGVTQADQTTAATYNIRVAPKPDKSYPLLVAYYQIPPTLSLDTHIPIFPGSEWDEGIIVFSLSRYVRQVGDNSASVFYSNEFFRILGELTKAYDPYGERYPRIMEDYD